ncbi:MAG: TonB-dependent receptor [Planctomycetes bacterium]|nr:TonB-dependent receptor [Planctomycetota bacterium]
MLNSGAQVGRFVLVLWIVCAIGVGAFAQENSKDRSAKKEKTDKKKEEKKGAKKEAKKEDEKTEEVEEIIVVAPPLIEGNKVNRLGAQVTTVRSGQIKDLNALDLGGALRRTPGVTHSRYNIVGGFGGADGGAVYIRGMGSRRPGSDITTYVDGIPDMVGVWGHPLMDTLSTNIAESIDIYKGASPILLGAGAFGGVNIKTKRRTEEGFEGSATGAGGSYGTWVETVEAGGKQGPYDFYFVESTRGSSGHRPKADGKVVEVFNRIGYQINDNFNAAFTVNYTDAWANDPGPTRDELGFAIPPPERNKFKVDEIKYLGELTNKFDNAGGAVKFYYNDGHIDWEQYGDRAPGRLGRPPGAPVLPWAGGRDGTNFYFESETFYDLWGIRLHEKVKPWKGAEVLAGFDFDNIGGEFAEDEAQGNLFDCGRVWYHIASPYANVSQLFGSKDSWYLMPTAGARFYGHSEYTNRWAPAAGIVGGYKNTEVHFRYARNILYPFIYAEVQEKLWKEIQPRNIWDHRDLRPEVGDHYELGVSHKFNDWLKGDATVFWDRQYDLFGFESHLLPVPPPPPVPPVNQLTNNGRMRSEGVELTATVTPTRDLALFAGATFLHSRESGIYYPTPPDAFIHSPQRFLVRSPNAPEFTLMAGMSWRFWKRFQLNLDGEYITRQYKYNPRFPLDFQSPLEAQRINDYFLMNGKLSYRFTPKGSWWQGKVFVAVENLTDTNYELRDKYPAPPAAAIFGAELRF